jgi:hypothetical protein
VQTSRKKYVAVPRFPLTSVLGLAVMLLWLPAQVPEHQVLGRVFPVPCRERTGLFSNYPFGLLQSLLGLLHKSYSDSAPFQEALGVLRFFPHLKSSIPDRTWEKYWKKHSLAQKSIHTWQDTNEERLNIINQE